MDLDLKELSYIIKNYLYTNQDIHFEELLRYNGGAIYRIIYSLLKRNGIYRDRLPLIEFNSLLFLTLKENFIEILLMSSSSRYFETLSRITNLMLKEINKQLYKESKINRNEVLSFDFLAPYEEPDIHFEANKKSIKSIIKLEADKLSYIDKRVMKLYFGIGASSLSVDEICKCINIKRSTAFAKIKSFKEKIKKLY